VYLLDTNVLSYLFRGTAGYEALFQRVREADPTTLFVSVISVEEMMQGALATIRIEQAKGGTKGYQRLRKLMEFLTSFSLVDYSDTEDSLFRALPASVRRRGRGDCQIATTAVCHNLTVVTCNIQHFADIAASLPTLTFEDWSRTT